MTLQVGLLSLKPTLLSHPLLNLINTHTMVHFPFVSSPKAKRHHRRGSLPGGVLTIIGGLKTKLPAALPKPSVKPSIKPTGIKITTKPALSTPAGAATTPKTTPQTAPTRASTIDNPSSSIRGTTSSPSSRQTPTPIPAGQPFAGRLEGGGTRDDIFGTRTYGSGYPGLEGRGTAGRGFPFYFWPVAWPAAALGGAGAAGVYLSDNDEYGSPSNTSRPGGQLTTVSFTSALDTSSSSLDTTTTTTPSQAGMTYRILSDNSTIADLVPHILSSCSVLLSIPASSNTMANYTGFDAPHPEEIIQYYRASSIALSMDGYNNSATYPFTGNSDGTENPPDSPLPTTADLNLMDCLNQTIGTDAPLADAAHSQNLADSAGSVLHLPNFSVAGVVGLLWLFRLLV
ncbi:hypothetical protein GALMADRAFT_144709 [Galerina marginata CBS 339.88]|uniref:Uncharacterized protein n=1 Tax=Galerina marginata (strain CBS 339.88) TaxID=685588 RepID=A0A067SHJ6_GALM3|nr:hypothetical protein GALMADRAFT_144709 [Galerina marginata CBS 339.88]